MKLFDEFTWKKRIAKAKNIFAIIGVIFVLYTIIKFLT